MLSTDVATKKLTIVIVGLSLSEVSGHFNNNSFVQTIRPRDKLSHVALWFKLIILDTNLKDNAQLYILSVP